MSLTRRQFTHHSARLGALGLAAQIFPPARALSLETPSAPPVGYAIIGLGRISDHFMAGIQKTSGSKVTALVSGHREKAEAIALNYGVPKSSIYSYENMDSLRDNKQVEAVYIGLPNSMHAEYSIRSAKAGKHVLCEKPMATSVTEAQAMIDAAKAAHVKLMIAYRCHYETTNLAAVKLIRDGAIGQIQSIQSAFGFNCPATEWRLQKALAGGGPLMDVGIYCLNATRYLTGEEPEHFSALSHTNPGDPRFRDVEENLTWISRFPSGIVASCNTSYGAPIEGFFRVYGSNGWLEVNPAFVYEGLRLTAHYYQGDKPDIFLDQFNGEKDPTHFTNQANHFSECIRLDRIPKTPGEEGLRDMQYIREIYRLVGITMA